MARRDIEAGRAFVRLGVKSSSFDRLIGSAGNTLSAFGKAATIVAGAATAAGASITAGITAAVVKFAATGDQLAKMARRTGVSATALGELGFAAERSGASLADIEKSVRRMQRTIVDANDGVGEGVDAFDRLGLSIADVSALSPEQQFEAFAQAISEIENPTLRAAAAMEVFGRGGTGLLPLIEDGAEGMAKLRAEARGLGVQVTAEQAAVAEAVTDSFSDMHTAFAALRFEIGSAFSPAVKAVVDSITNLGVKLQAVVKIMATGFEAAAVSMKVSILGLGGAFDALTSGTITVFEGMMNELIRIVEEGVNLMVKPLLAVGATMQSLGAMAVGLLTGQSTDQIRNKLRGIQIATAAMAPGVSGAVSAVASSAAGTARSVVGGLATGARAATAGAGGSAASALVSKLDALVESLRIDVSGGGRGIGDGGSGGTLGARSRAATATFNPFAASAGSGGIAGDIRETRRLAKEELKESRKIRMTIEKKLGFT